MSADSVVTYTFVHSEARSWSIPSEDPYEEAARQLLEQAPRSPEYVPDPIELEDHVPVYIPEPEHLEDLVPAEDEAPIEEYITEVAFEPLPPPSFLPPLIRPTCTRAAMDQMRAAAPSLSSTSIRDIHHSVETRGRDTERRMMAALESAQPEVRAEIVHVNAKWNGRMTTYFWEGGEGLKRIVRE
ncbi:hypothetical protein Tco_0974646 [Tanacetum coccineum]|uniref:Uncharacterized protein n=1 Tax=Tanacetum coccineum TaxID=301880 RepID=A0ABQ5EC64_9ASTR